MNVLSPASTIGGDLDCAQAELARLRTQLAWLRAERAALWYAVSHDELTGLANRRLFFALAPSLLRTGQPAVVVALDLNGFKPINDTYGHEAGDQVLQAVAQRLTAVADGNLVARLGGDEFIAVLTNPYRHRSPQWWRPAVTALSTAIAQPMPVAGRLVAVTASIGIASVYEDVLIDELLRRADMAMYHSKKHRRSFAVWGVDTGDGMVKDRRGRSIVRDQDRCGNTITISTSRVVELAIFPAALPAEQTTDPAALRPEETADPPAVSPGETTRPPVLPAAETTDPPVLPAEEVGGRHRQTTHRQTQHRQAQQRQAAARYATCATQGTPEYAAAGLFSDFRYDQGTGPEAAA
jgi:diguanylate cyclase (GGDEF)-like protein